MEQGSKYILIQLKDEEYGVHVQQVRSIERLQDITKVPRTADFIKGIINLRGEVIPIIDLKERLNIGKTDNTDQTRCLIVPVHRIQVGFVVDSATDVIDIDDAEIDTVSEFIGHKYFTGIAKLEDRLLVLLNLEQILNLEEINELKEFTKQNQYI